jgi:raffinose/stachyose/melibiose transport system substrate-binding protein
MASPSRRLAVACSVTLVLVTAGLVGTQVAPASRGTIKSTTLHALLASNHKPGWDAMIAAFEQANPDITITPTYVDATTEGNLLTTDIAAGNAPDLVYLGDGYSSAIGLQRIANAGDLVDLTSQPWVKNFSGPMKLAVTWAGKVYAFPFAVFMYAVAYNTDLFSQLGLKVPTTIAQVYSLCQTISQHGLIPFAAGLATYGQTPVLVGQLDESFVFNKIPDWNKQRKTGKLTFSTTPGWNQVWQVVSTMIQKGCFGNQGAAAAASNVQQFGQLANGQAVMSFLATTQTGSVKAINPNVNIGWFNLPGPSTKDQQVPGGTSNIAILNRPENQANIPAAEKFLAFLSQPANSVAMNTILGSMSPVELEQGVVPDYIAGLRPLLTKTNNRFRLNHFFFWPNAGYSNTLGLDVQGLATGQLSIPKILSGLDFLWGNLTVTTPPS